MNHSRRALLAVGALLGVIPHRALASGNCPDRGHEVEPMPSDVLDLIRRRLLDRLAVYAGPSPAVVRTMPELHPPGGTIGIGGTVFFFETPSVDDPEFPYLWRIDAYCQKPQL